MPHAIGRKKYYIKKIGRDKFIDYTVFGGMFAGMMLILFSFFEFINLALVGAIIICAVVSVEIVWLLIK